MSAFIVLQEHIDALVEAAAAVVPGEHRSGLSWWTCTDLELRQSSHAEREAWRREIGCSDRARASEVGMMLWAENLASIDYRYPDCVETGGYPGPNDFTRDSVLGYVFSGSPMLRRSPVAILKAIDCYDYQSCEHPGWVTSEARNFCQALRAKMIGQLPGYRDAQWEIEVAR